MRPRAGLDGYRKSRPHRDSVAGPSSRCRVSVPTALSLPRVAQYTEGKAELLSGSLVSDQSDFTIA